MVVSSSNRSPSPMSTRPNPNPNSRTHQEPEGVVPARKSFSGYPLGKPSIISQPRSFIPNTPANSPAEFAKRNSFSRDHEQKENERDHPNSKPIAARPRSPSVPKGSKNFMSPTISAASKINPSPRKKVLGERNEAIRTSASLSDGKFQFFSTSSLEFSDENEPKRDTEYPTTHFDKVPAQNVAECNLEERKIELEPDLVVLSPEVPLNITESSDQILPLVGMPKLVAESNVGLDVKNTCSSPSVIAPLDADPSLPPYDPKTNYLSPRPQFLCYKPNPRIESYINQGLRLEDEFASESCSETENSEATWSENSPKEQEDSSSSTEGTSPVEEKPPFSEQEEAPEPKIEPRPRVFTKSKTVAVTLIFLLGLIISTVTYTPSFGNATCGVDIKSMVYHDPHAILDLAKVNFYGLVQRAKLWSAHSVGHLSQMIHSLREVNEFSPVLFSNLTGWAGEEDYVVADFELGSFFERKEDGDSMIQDFGLSFVETEDGQAATMDTTTENSVELESNPETAGQKPPVEVTNLAVLDDSEPEKLEENSVLSPGCGEDSLLDIEDLNVTMMGQSSLAHEAENQEVGHVQEETDISSDVGFGFQNDAKAEGSSSQDPGVDHNQVEDIGPDLEFEFQDDAKAEGFSSQDPEVQPEVLSVPLGEDDDQSSLNNVERQETIEEVQTNSEVVPEATPSSTRFPLLSEGILAPTAATVSSVVASLLASAAAVIWYMKPKKANLPVSVPLADQLTVKEKSMMEKSVASVEASMIRECLPSSWSGPVEVDMISEPCASEMSSYRKTSSHSKRSGQRGADEAQSQSQERRPKRDYSKRESLASSSSEYTMCSSYGSFTTYSVIPLKKGDAEVVTPVRRSSRIRNQVTSP